MKRILSACFLLLLLTQSWHISAAKRQVCITSGEWPPNLSSRLPEYGFASHIIEQAFAKVDVEVHYVFYPWKRSYAYAKEGRTPFQPCHASAIWQFTEERSEYFLYSSRVLTEYEFLYHLNDNDIEWEQIRDLAGLTIGATLHTVYPELERAASQGYITIERAGDYEKLFQRLLMNRVDAVPMISGLANYYFDQQLNDAQKQRISYADKALSERHYHLIFSKANPESKEMLALFNQGLMLLQDSHEYQGLLSRWQSGFYFQAQSLLTPKPVTSSP
ncbi:substrate-binding periplasmic protein [Aliagarivorans marinus]|uniref:substrate-binding periplasmic protein n=1 Tax=Aliagarivorans marinus TaxID=561965 RepID=UPI0003FC55B1|nr:transporter substrate-binding domain-containing protein [Aliagarivorans marinus]